MKNTKLITVKLIVGLIWASILLISSCNKTNVQKTFVNPPFPELDVPFETFMSNTEMTDTISLTMGTKLIIPEKAFVDSAGNRVSGDVQLKYREFRNAAEIFMAGIPMNYNAMGNKTALVTAGMFEIRAFANGSELKLAPGKNITMKMGSRVEGQNYNFFGFDESNGNWQFMGYPNTEVNPEYEKVEKNITQLKKTKKYPLSDEYFVFDYSAAYDVTYYELGKKYSKNKMKRRIKKYGANLYNLYTYDRVNYRGRHYRAQFLLWKKLGDNRLPRWVKTKRIRSEVKKLAGNVYLITVKHKEKNYKFRAAIEMPLKALYAYSPDYLKKHYEEAMQKVEEENKRLAMEAKVFRTFQVSRLGICNYDDLYNPKEALYVKANFGIDFISEDEKMYTGGQIYMVPGSRRSVLTINGFQNQRVAIDQKDTGVRLFTLLPNGEIGIIDNNELQKLDFDVLSSQLDPKIRLKFRKWDKKISSKDDVLALFGISGSENI